MKKIILISILLVVLWVPDAARAGDNTDPRLSQIEDAVRAVYPDKKVNIFSEPRWNGTRFNCKAPDWHDDIAFTVLGDGSLRDRTLGSYEAREKLERLEMKIKKIFKPNDQKGAK